MIAHDVLPVAMFLVFQPTPVVETLNCKREDFRNPFADETFKKSWVYFPS